MPTFDDPRKDAAEASAALRGLAYATRTFADPADTYPVIGDLLGGVRSLRQVLNQLAVAHVTHLGRARDDAGNEAAGSASVLAAADELHRADTLLDRVEERLNSASQHSGRIAWQSTAESAAIDAPGPQRIAAQPMVKADARSELAANDTPQHDPAAAVAGRRWISVVFLDGSEADGVLDLIRREGTDAAIAHLSGFDVGEEATQAALENGYVYDTPPTGALDRTATGGVYTLTYNPFLGHVSLLREYKSDPERDDSELTPATTRVTERAGTRADRAGAAMDWFTRAPASTSHSRGLAL